MANVGKAAGSVHQRFSGGEEADGAAVFDGPDACGMVHGWPSARSVRTIAHTKEGAGIVAMTHREALEVLAANRGRHLVIMTHGSVDLWASLSDTPLDLAYVPASMG